MRALVLLLCAACFGQGTLPPEPSPTDENTKTIAGVGTFISTYDWQRTPWYRIEDMGISLPVLVIIAQDGSACLVEGKDWAIAQAGKRFACPGKWRFARPR